MILWVLKDWTLFLPSTLIFLLVCIDWLNPSKSVGSALWYRTMSDFNVKTFHLVQSLSSL